MEKLKELLLEREETMNEISQKTGLSRQTICNIRNGKQPSFLTIKKICKYFNVDYKDYI